MSKIILLVATLSLLACRQQVNDPNPAPTPTPTPTSVDSGTYEAHTWSNSGPFASKTLIVKSDSGQELIRLTSDIAGLASTKLAVGFYRILPFDSTTAPIEHRVQIRSKETLHDTIIYQLSSTPVTLMGFLRSIHTIEFNITCSKILDEGRYPQDSPGHLGFIDSCRFNSLTTSGTLVFEVPSSRSWDIRLDTIGNKLNFRYYDTYWDDGGGRGAWVHRQGLLFFDSLSYELLGNSILKVEAKGTASSLRMTQRDLSSTWGHTHSGGTSVQDGQFGWRIEPTDSVSVQITLR
jgi:hypothetical protein